MSEQQRRQILICEITMRFYIQKDEPKEVITMQEEEEPDTTRAPALPGSEYYELTLDDFEVP